MRTVFFILLILGTTMLFADDFGRDVSMDSGLEDTQNDLKSNINTEFIKQAAKGKASHGRQSGGIYTEEGSQTVGSTILQNSKVQNVYNYSEIKGPVVNVNKK